MGKKVENVVYRKAYKHGSGVVVPLPKLMRDQLGMHGGVYLRMEVDVERRVLVIEVAP